MVQRKKSSHTGINSLHETLYGRDGAKVKKQRRVIRSEEVYEDIDHTWGQREKRSEHQMLEGALRKEQERKPFMRYIFMLVFVIFLGSAGYLWWSLTDERSQFSVENVAVILDGNTFVDGGEDVNLRVQVTNANPLPVQLADLTIEYPLTSDGDLTEKQRHVVGDVSSGGTFNEQYPLVLFGEEGEERIITATLEFRIPGSTAIFTKSENFRVGLRSSPIRTAFTLPETSFSNQVITGSLEVSSNSLEPIENLLVMVDATTMFDVNLTRPATESLDELVWVIPVLQPNEKRVFEVDGIARGVPGDELLLKTRVGKPRAAGELEIGTVLGGSSRLVRVDESFLRLTIQAEGVSGEGRNILTPGRTTQFVVEWEHVGEEPLQNVEIVAVLDGTMFDPTQVDSRNGFYDANTNRIIWTQSEDGDLAYIEPGTFGQLEFEATPLSTVSAADQVVQNPEFNLALDITGLSTSGQMVTAKNVQERTYLFSSQPRLNLATLHASGPLPNTGSIPPQAGKETTYTLKWDVLNTSHDLADARISARLPTGVQWLNSVSSASGHADDLQYMPSTNTVIWDIGDIAAGAGFGQKKPEVFFQVRLTPGLNQVGNKAALTNNVRFEARDTVTSEKFTISRQGHTSQLQGDIVENNGRVLP